MNGLLEALRPAGSPQNDSQIPVFRPLIEREEIAAATEALEMGWLGMGCYVGRFEEALQVTRKLFQGESIDFESDHHQLRGVRLLPGMRRRGGPPILIGTLNPRPRMRRLVAQHADIWNGWLGYTDAGPESAATQLRIIDDACREHGRDPNTLVATTAVRAAMPGSGYTPRSDERPLSGSPKEMAETLRGHATLGISEVQVALTMGGPEGVHAFAAVIEELRAG